MVVAPRTHELIVDAPARPAIDPEVGRLDVARLVAGEVDWNHAVKGGTMSITEHDLPAPTDSDRITQLEQTVAALTAQLERQPSDTADADDTTSATDTD